MRILIVDDHELVRKGVRSLLLTHPGLEVCGEAVDGHDAIAKSRDLQPDVIVMDISMPRLNGLDATREIRRVLPQANVLILSQHDSPQMMQQALNAGARGYVLKSDIAGNLLAGIAKLEQGQTFFNFALFGRTSHLDMKEILQSSAAFEEALRESEERFRLTFEQAAVGLAHIAQDGHWLRVNQKLCDVLGYTPEELKELTFQDITHPADLGAVLARVEKVVTGELDQFSLEKRSIRQDGTFMWVELTVSAVRDNQHKVKYFVAVIEDISARKQAEGSLAEVARQQNALFRLADRLHHVSSLEDVYSVALDAIMAALICDRASVLLGGAGGSMRFVSWRGLSEEYRRVVDGHSAWKRDERNPRPVCIEDVERSGLSESLKATLKQEGIRALAFIPLISNGELIGKFMAYFNSAHAFSEDEIDLSLTIAGELAFAIERQRAQDALRESEARLASEAEALAKLNAWGARLWRVRSLEQGLDEMLAAVVELVGAAKGFVQLLDPERDVLEIVVQRGFDPVFLDAFRQVSLEDGSACGRALRLNEPVVVEDVETDAPYAPYREVARAAGYRAVISVPLMGAEGTPVGVISTHFAAVRRAFAPDLRRLNLFARQAADFIRRCKAEEALRQSDERLRKLAADLEAEVRARTAELEMRNRELLVQSERVRDLSGLLLQAQDAERRRIARELHDSAGQILTGLSLSLAALNICGPEDKRRFASTIQQSQQLVKELSREIRTMSYLLYPPMLDERGLAEALRWYVQGLTERAALQVELDIPEDFERLPAAMELAIFRIVQEALTNVHRHSGSNSATIRLAQDGAAISVEIVDRGKGIPPDKLRQIQSSGHGVGIRGMWERVRQAKGDMEIDSGAAGTKIKAIFPLAEAPGEKADLLLSN